MFLRLARSRGEKDVDVVDIASEGETGDDQWDTGSDGYDGSQPCGRAGVNDEGWCRPENTVREDYYSYDAEES